MMLTSYINVFLSSSFLSSLLTSVLSLHLAWVYTVSKTGGSPAGRHHDKMASKSVSRHALLLFQILFVPCCMDVHCIVGVALVIPVEAIPLAQILYYLFIAVCV